MRKKRTSNSGQTIVSLVAVTISFTFTLAFTFRLIFDVNMFDLSHSFMSPDPRASKEKALETKINSLIAKNMQLERDLALISNIVFVDSSLGPFPDSSSSYMQVLQDKLSIIDRQVEINSSAISRIDGLFLSDAERFVTIPLLKRDIQSIKDDIEQTKQSTNTFRELQTETNSQTRWLIGAIAIPLFSLSIALAVPVLKDIFSKSQRRHGTSTKDSSSLERKT